MNYKDQPADALNYLAQRGNPYVFNLQDTQGDFGIDLGLTGAPESFVIDGERRIRLHIVGELNAQIWQRQVQPCFAQIKAGGSKPCA